MYIVIVIYHYFNWLKDILKEIKAQDACNKAHKKVLSNPKPVYSLNFCYNSESKMYECNDECCNCRKVQNKNSN